MSKMTFLMPHGSNTATKKFEFVGGKWELKNNYVAGKYFKGFEYKVEGLQDFFDLLEENQYHPVFLIHGKIKDGVDKNNMLRRKRGDDTTIENTELSIFCVDVDNFNGSIDDFIAGLPEPFQLADYIFQYSASYGLTKTNLNCHLFFELETKISNVTLCDWAKNSNINHLDSSIYNAAQPIYTQRRECIGAPDPITEFIGYIKKNGKLNWKPEDFPASQRVRPQEKTHPKYDIKSGIQKILNADNYHAEINSLALSLANQKIPRATIKELIKGAMKSVEKQDQRWQTRYDDIDRSVNSAFEIINQPTLTEVIEWLKEASEADILANFMPKCLHLQPIEKTIVINTIAEQTGHQKSDIKKTLKLAEQEAVQATKEQKQQAQTQKREERGITELTVTPINSGAIALQAGTILAESTKEPQVYHMGEQIAYIDIASPKTIRQCVKKAEMGIDYPPSPVIRYFRKPFYSLIGRMEKDIVFQNQNKADIEPPTKVLHMVGEAINPRFKTLTGIVEHPFVNMNWEIVQDEGYNDITGLYTVLHKKLKIKLINPAEAFDYLRNVVLAEFPFNSDLDAVVTIAAFMTALQRPTITGDTGLPGFGIVSPIQSSGKTTLAQLISYAIFNRPVAASSWSDDDEELGKHILAILQEGHSCVLFDNIKQGTSIQSGRLANAMSNDIFGGRQLGENKTIEVPSAVIWLFTGNGIKFVGDFATRIYPITINPKMADPNVRKFKRENVGQWAMENRKKIISALLSIILIGQEDFCMKSSSRFKLWDKFVRVPLYRVSGCDVNDVIQNNQQDDPIILAKINLLENIFETFGRSQFTTRELLKKSMNVNGSQELGNMLGDLLGSRANNALSVAKFLGNMVDVVFRNHVLKRRRSNMVYWNVENFEEGKV
jgi:hypothetical protein